MYLNSSGGSILLIVAIRTFILYAAVLFAVRMMGKSELSKMSPFQMVVLFMIAELAAIPIDSTSASLINGVMAIVTLMFLQIFISWLSTKCEWFKNFITDKPSILVEKGRLNIKELKRLRITNTDLMEQLRLENCPSLSDVQYAVMESNGQLTVIPKAKNRPLTPKDLELAVTEGVLPMLIVSDGKLYEKNLLALGLSRESFEAKLKKSGIESHKDIFLAFFDENKQLHAYLASGKGGGYDLSWEVKL